MDAATSALVDEVRRLSPEKAFRAYLELCDTAPDKAQVAALALRDKARAGELPDDCVALLDTCLAEAPDSVCAAHLAKALAAFGRRAQPAAPTLCARIRDLHVTDDVGYWILDGCLFALGFLGGAAAKALLDALDAEAPSRAVRSDSVYDGELSREERGRRYADALARVRALVEQRDPGVWRPQQARPTRAPSPRPPATEGTPAPAEEPKAGPSKKSWMVR